MGIIFIITLAAIGVYFLARKEPRVQPSDADKKKILQEHILFYQQLTEDEKSEFEKRVWAFLDKVRITGVKTTIEDLDKVFVAAAAIIPVFEFKGWEYDTIHEVLIYPTTFNKDYHVEGKDRQILGMVGEGAMQNLMILSKQELRNGFLNKQTKSNTAIHEFVHLVDKEDGYTDGCPEALLPHQYALPWLKHIHEEIKKIKSGKSDINPYGATNEAEFLAVAAEYFFKQPQRMQQKNPELYELLEKVFMPGNKV